MKNKYSKSDDDDYLYKEDGPIDYLELISLLSKKSATVIEVENDVAVRNLFRSIPNFRIEISSPDHYITIIIAGQIIQIREVSFGIATEKNIIRGY